VQLEEVEKVLIEFYVELYTSSKPGSYLETSAHVAYSITVEMNESLVGEFMEWEVSATLKQMAPLKAPILGGMPPLFFQHFWQVIDHDITQSILTWPNTGTLPRPVNHTFITLISKIKNLELVSEYRPISLCNVLCKILSKVLANRLKKFLPHLIIEHQLTFAKNRLITTNILVAFETLHYMKKHVSGKNEFMTIKLDMSKKYDRVEWIFLENLMRQMGFYKRWIDLIMLCVKIVSYSILVNGEPKGLISYKRYMARGPTLPFPFPSLH